jgi:hypothetical protein
VIQLLKCSCNLNIENDRTRAVVSRQVYMVPSRYERSASQTRNMMRQVFSTFTEQRQSSSSTARRGFSVSVQCRSISLGHFSELVCFRADKILRYQGKVILNQNTFDTQVMVVPVPLYTPAPFIQLNYMILK